MIRTNKHGIRVIDGSFSRMELMMLKEKDPIQCGKRFAIARDRSTYPTLKEALEKAR